MVVFVQRKTAILNNLGSDEPDLSPKGRPDDEVLDLLELINSHEDYVSTSSCSGRAVVFLDADKNGHGEKAKGRWLMNLHTPFRIKQAEFSTEELYDMFFGDMEVGENRDSKGHHLRLVNLKFEPLIVHVLCRDIPSACMLLHCATSVGYRESGMSISGAATPKEKIIVAVRTTAIRLEIPLATCDGNGRIRPFGLSQEYLNTLVKLVNGKFEENEVRKQSLLASLRLAFKMKESHSMDGITQTETKDERRIRKRKEGLMLQQAASRIKDNSARAAQDLDDDPNELSSLAIDIP